MSEIFKRELSLLVRFIPAFSSPSSSFHLDVFLPPFFSFRLGKTFRDFLLEMLG